MVAKILDGKSLSIKRLRILKNQIDEYCVNKRRPCLVTILVGEDPASKLYVQRKHITCQELGIISRGYFFEQNITTNELLKLIKDLNNDKEVDGVLVQLPLPKQIETSKVINCIEVSKDVDGFHPQNIGKLLLNYDRGLFSCTPKGIMCLLESIPVNLSGKVALIIGASNIVGKPMSMFLINAGMTVMVAQKTTMNLSDLVKVADLVISAVGCPFLVKGEWLKKGSIVIDVGMNRLPDHTLVGDVDFKTAVKNAAWITPVPGGVGPMTVEILMENTWEAYLQHVEE